MEIWQTFVMQTLYTYFMLTAAAAATGDVSKIIRSKRVDSTTTCAADEPSLVISMTRGSDSRCAAQCNQERDCCLLHQYNKSKSQCQLYQFWPQNWVGSDGCNAFFIEENTATNTVDAQTACTFPFTFNGQLFYQCPVNYSTTPCSIWCFDANHREVNCSTASYGYVAKNTTVNVKITSDVIVSLQTVAGWLTVLSRVDSSFPLGQDSSAYINGFGNAANNFWLGLEKIYQLTNRAVNGGVTYKLRFELLQANIWYSIEYDFFFLDASASYTFRASTTSYGDVVDIVNSNLPANNKPFVSYSSWCFNQYGPWWYTDPYTTCCYGRMLGDATNFGFYWKISDSNFQSQVTRMMVKAIN